MINDDWPKGAVMMTQHLDLLTDEPLELAVALQKLAEAKASADDGTDDDLDAEVWAKFVERMDNLVSELKALNEPSRADDAKSE